MHIKSSFFCNLFPNKEFKDEIDHAKDIVDPIVFKTKLNEKVDERTLEDFKNKDLKPFIAGIESGVPSIMVNHNIIKEVDDQKPASISKPVHDILRNDLDYSGLIVTDSLSMDAIKQYVQNGEAAAEAVIAGNDMIISATLEAHVNEILKAIEDGRITKDQIDTACRRVLACKMAYGIIGGK